MSSLPSLRTGEVSVSATKAHQKVGVQLHFFLTSTLDLCGQLHAPAALSLHPKPGAHLAGALVRPSAVLDNLEKRKISCPCLASNTGSSLSRIWVLITYCVPFIYLNVGTHCLWFNPYPTAFPYGNGMVLHFYQQQESSTTKTVDKFINKGLKTYVYSLHTGENFH